MMGGVLKEGKISHWINCSIKNVNWRTQWHETCGTSNLRGKPSIPSFLRKLRILKAWDFKSWENYKCLGLLCETFWVWKTNTYPLSGFWESLCPCEAYCNILPLKNPLAFQEKEKMKKHGSLPCFGVMKRRINLSIISHEMNSGYDSMFLIFHLINQHIWREWSFEISNCILLCRRKLVSPICSPSATKSTPKSWGMLPQGKRQVWYKTRSFQDWNWEALAMLTGGVLGETRKRG